jgi:hypothetical protein
MRIDIHTYIYIYIYIVLSGLCIPMKLILRFCKKASEYNLSDRSHRIASDDILHFETQSNVKHKYLHYQVRVQGKTTSVSELFGYQDNMFEIYFGNTSSLI